MDIQQLELLCKQMYESQDAGIRGEAEKALCAFQESPDALTQCQQLLDRGESSYSQLLAATTLSKLISKNVHGLSLRQRVDIRNYLLNYLATRGALQAFVVQALVTLLAKITKYGWFDQFKEELVFRNILEDVKKFLQQGSVDHCVIGVQILSQLTVVMNQVADLDANLTFTKHRETACSFRDTQLFDIFLLSCSLLSTARDNSKSLNFNAEPQFGLMNHILRLTRNCLSFDFIGTSNDDSIDDMSTVQIPTNWRPAFLDPNTLQLFFDLYHALPARLASLSLSTLVQITSVRRSLVTNAERAKFLTHLVNGIRDILERGVAGLAEPDNFHEFCRLLARLKTNFQLGELINVDSYAQAIALIAKFTVESLRAWQFSPNSIHYLLSLWQRLVASVQFFKDAKPHLLERYTPEITAAYIKSRLDAVPIILRDGLDEPLDDLGMVQQQLEQLCVIERCEYEKTVQLLVQLFDQTAGGYQEVLAAQAGAAVATAEVTVHEHKLTWLVYVIGSAISGRMSFTTNDEHDVMDGELVVRVLQLMQLTDGRLAQAGCERLELAIITFLDQLRKFYIIEQTQKVKIYTRMLDLLGINDEQMLLSVINRKIITNLKYWGRSETIIRKTLSLLNELSISFNCVRKLVKLDEIQFILNNHTSEHFSFLGTNVAVSEMRFRSLFYTSLGRLLMVDLGEDEDRFYNCLQPLTNAFESIGAQLRDTSTYPSEETKKALIGLARDLRGFAYASTSRNVYMMFFDWIYPNYTPIMLRALELWPHDPTVTTPVLKLFAELVKNRSQRLMFELASPNGILLFREASKAICCYGSRILTLDVPKDQQYPMRLKGIAVCFIMLKAALSGNYVYFGVFKLYGDDTLANVLNVAAKLIVSIPRRDLIEFPKLSKAYYLLLECLAQDHIAFLTQLEPTVFVYILESLCDGLVALDTTVCTSCCSTLDNIVFFIFKQLQMKASTFQSKKFRRSNIHENDLFMMMEVHQNVLQRILSTILNTVMFEDCKNQWSMSRPLLGLILLNEEYFSSLKANIIRSQQPEKQQALATWFNNLMDGVERNLLTKNRDRFTQNLSLFRRDINDSLKSAQFACSSSSSQTSGVTSNVSLMSINDMIVS